MKWDFRYFGAVAHSHDRLVEFLYFMVIYLMLFHLLFDQEGNYGKAIAIFQGIHKDLVEEFGEDHPRVAAALHNEAVANLRAGLMHDALEKMIEAIRIRKLTLGGAHSKVAVSSRRG